MSALKTFCANGYCDASLEMDLDSEASVFEQLTNKCWTEHPELTGAWECPDHATYWIECARCAAGKSVKDEDDMVGHGYEKDENGDWFCRSCIDYVTCGHFTVNKIYIISNKSYGKLSFGRAAAELKEEGTLNLTYNSASQLVKVLKDALDRGFFSRVDGPNGVL